MASSSLSSSSTRRISFDLGDDEPASWRSSSAPQKAVVGSKPTRPSPVTRTSSDRKRKLGALSAGLVRAKVKASASIGGKGQECGICLEPAATPCKMRCCGTLYCFDHLSDWLYGSSSSDSRCPSCSTPTNSTTPPLKRPLKRRATYTRSPSPTLPHRSLPSPTLGILKTSRAPVVETQVVSSSIHVLVQRMIGRVLSIVGLTLFLWVLLST